MRFSTYTETRTREMHAARERQTVLRLAWVLAAALVGFTIYTLSE